MLIQLHLSRATFCIHCDITHVSERETATARAVSKTRPSTKSLSVRPSGVLIGLVCMHSVCLHVCQLISRMQAAHDFRANSSRLYTRYWATAGISCAMAAGWCLMQPGSIGWQRQVMSAAVCSSLSWADVSEDDLTDCCINYSPIHAHSVNNFPLELTLHEWVNRSCNYEN